ncbi:MAG TPA: L-threonylcarbamoyladenylate synthase [Kofleriaceae bacterium]|nr:L-threonylcarbamoyladenylate synthase [Kofleriaceae bacterium]
MQRGTDTTLAASVLARGGLVAFPTETVYGLGADATRPEAIAKVFAVKGRPAAHPLIVHVAPGAALDEYARDVPASARALASAFWPGPLTIILKRGKRIAAEATGGSETVGLRVPSHPMAIELLVKVGVPIAAPSANRFGRVSPTTADHVAADLGDDIEYLLDGGACSVGVESTIVDLSDASAPALLRPGGVSRAELERVLAQPLGARTSTPAPGTLPSHYAPRARVIAVAPDQLASAARAAGARVAILAPHSVIAGAKLPPDLARIALPDAPDAEARALYAALRELDARGVDTIIAALPADTSGVAEAIADRLRRAAGPREDGT